MGDVAASEIFDDPPPIEATEGLPEPCPRCGRPGYLDGIDLRGGLKHERCLVCHHHWSTPLPSVPVASRPSAGRSTRTGLAERLARAGGALST